MPPVYFANRMKHLRIQLAERNRDYKNDEIEKYERADSLDAF